MLLLGLVETGVSEATEIDGKWGLGISVGTLFSSGAEASIIRGTSARTAWIMDVFANVMSDRRQSVTDFKVPYYPDTTIAGHIRSESFDIELGPRLRQFARPTNPF